MTGALRLEAPAKLNLTLTVTGRRPDGKHLLESVFVLLELADGMLLMPGSAGLRVEGDEVAGVPLDRSNLAWRGFAHAVGAEPVTGSLALEKRIPVAAGLGGGSSDAAAAWRLGRAWIGDERLPTTRELDALADIGADVPFFASCAAAARVTGIGERVEPLQSVATSVVLAHPPFGLSTRAIFAELRPDEWRRADNDLLAPARRLRPELDELFDLVARSGGEPRLTGSGPTVFSKTDDAEHAARIAGRLRAAGVRTTLTRTRTAAASIETISQEA